MTEDAVQSFYEKEAKIYDETRFRGSHGTYSDFVQKSAFLELIGDCKGKRILEIGSGTGRFTRELAKRGATVVCVDLSRRMHERSRSVKFVDAINFFVMSGVDLGFAAESFDGCVTVNMMSHIRNNIGVFNEVRRVLKRGGFFVANFPNLSSIYLPIGGFVNLFERSLQVPVYSRWYSFRSVMCSLRFSGLNPVSVHGRMIFPKKYCPAPLFVCLKQFNSKVSNSSLVFLSGDLFVRSVRF